MISNSRDIIFSWLSKIPPLTTRNLWILLAFLVATQNCAVFYTSQSANTSILAIMIWGGALICIEDQLDDLRPEPSILGIILGSCILLFVLARTSIILHWDGTLFILAPMAGLALALLCLSIRSLLMFRDAFLCLMLLPSYALLLRFLPERPLSHLTAQGAGFFLSILGFDVFIDHRKIILPGGGVEVLAACNGLDMISQVMCIAIIFLLAFRIKSVFSKIFLLASAPIIGLISNCFRIALLAYFSSSGQGKGSPLFTFFHDDSGSLVFSGISVFLFGLLYMRLLERELPPIDSV